MSLSSNLDGDPRRQPRLTPQEERIAQAVVAALMPVLESIIQRLDAIEKEQKTQHAMIIANHEDIMRLEQKLDAFRKEQDSWRKATDEHWERLDANVDYLLHHKD